MQRLLNTSLNNVQGILQKLLIKHFETPLVCTPEAKISLAGLAKAVENSKEIPKKKRLKNVGEDQLTPQPEGKCFLLCLYVCDETIEIVFARYQISEGRMSGFAHLIPRTIVLQ